MCTHFPPGILEGCRGRAVGRGSHTRTHSPCRASCPEKEGPSPAALLFISDILPSAGENVGNRHRVHRDSPLCPAISLSPFKSTGVSCLGTFWEHSGSNEKWRSNLGSWGPGRWPQLCQPPAGKVCVACCLHEPSPRRQGSRCEVCPRPRPLTSHLDVFYGGTICWFW